MWHLGIGNSCQMSAEIGVAMTIYELVHRTKVLLFGTKQTQPLCVAKHGNNIF